MEEGKLNNVIQAKKQISEGSLVIWNARVETLVRMGDFGGLIDALKGDVLNYNCSCPGDIPSKTPHPLALCVCDGLTKEWLGEEMFKSISGMTDKAE